MNFLRSIVLHPRFLVVLLAGLILDQETKFLAKKYLADLVVQPTVGFVYHENVNIAFSIPVPGALVPILAFLLFIIILVVWGKELLQKNDFTRLILALLFAGAIGNILDRFLHGFVIDFIKLGNFPVFNMADSMITLVGILCLLYYRRIFKT